jgi:hypothetical protein
VCVLRLRSGELTALPGSSCRGAWMCAWVGILLLNRHPSPCPFGAHSQRYRGKMSVSGKRSVGDASPGDVCAMRHA